VKRNRGFRRVKVSADGEGLVSRAGAALLRELSVDTGLVGGWSDVLLDTYRALPTVHEPGRVLADLAVVIADGGDALAHLATLRDQDKLFGTVASAAGRAGRGAGTGVGGRRRTGASGRVDDRHRRHHHDRPL